MINLIEILSGKRPDDNEVRRAFGANHFFTAYLQVIGNPSTQDRTVELLRLATMIETDTFIGSPGEIAQSKDFAGYCYALAASSNSPPAFADLLIFKHAEMLAKTPMLLARRLDLAHEIYQICHLAPNGNYSFREKVDEIKKSAFDLMKNILNATTMKEIEEGLKDRIANKDIHPEYIPGTNPVIMPKMPDPHNVVERTAKIGNKEKVLTKIMQFKWRSAARDALAIKRNIVMTVNSQSQFKDQTKGTIMLTPEQRDTHRIHISNRKFVSRSRTRSDEFHVFDTGKMKSHGKQGFAAYVINMNGEISVFNHHNMADHYAHSSMNAGKPVMAAGEVQIHNGKLIALTTHSGHYKPSAQNVYETLKHFQKNGIDISKTTLISLDPFAVNLPIKESAVMEDDVLAYFTCNAYDFFQAAKNRDDKYESEKNLAAIKNSVEDLLHQQRQELMNQIMELYKLIPYPPQGKEKLLQKDFANIYHMVVEPYTSHKGIGVKFNNARNNLILKLPECREILINRLVSSIKDLDNIDVSKTDRTYCLEIRTALENAVLEAQLSSSNDNIDHYPLVIRKFSELSEQADILKKKVAELVNVDISSGLESSATLFPKKNIINSSPVNDPELQDNIDKKLKNPK